MKAELPHSDITEQEHIFISYSSKDRAFVDRLAEDLRVRGHVVWIDFEGIRGGDRWKQSIADGLHASRVALLVLSPESIESEWVEEEMETVLDLQQTRDLKLIPLLLRPVENITQPSIKWIYAEIQYIDFTEGYQLPFDRLLEDLPEPEKGVPGHCQKIIAELAAAPWGLDHYIQGEAKILPIDASPYEGGMVKKQRENLLQHLWENERTIVLGEPGVGKSVALERLAWELARKIIVPITVRLLQYDGDDLLKWLRLDLIRHHEIDLDDLSETRQFLKNPHYPCYFLLDGLNEVRPEHREKAIAEIEQLALEYQHPLVVTSRVQDDSWQRLRQGRAFQHIWVVQTIRQEQVQQYLTGHLGEDDSQRLWDQLGNDSGMRGLVQTPLLLWLLKEAWREARNIRDSNTIRMPENRGELYQNFVARMLRRDDERRLNQQVSEQERSEALRKLAAVLNDRQSLTISAAEARTIVKNEVLLDALKINGLLKGDSELRFAPHQTIQEHFAALALRDGIDIPGMVKIAPFGAVSLPKFMRGMTNSPLNYTDDPYWAETFIQLAGLTADPNQLARRVAGHNPWLAWWCVSEGQKVDDATKAVIEKQSIAMVRSDNVRDRRQAARALAQIKTERVIEPLATLFLDKDQEISDIAEQALHEFGQAGENAIIARCEQVLPSSKDTDERLRIARVLSKIKNNRVMPHLIPLSVDADAAVVETALAGSVKMGEVGVKASVQAFQEYSDSMSVQARASWGRGIADVDPRPGVGLNTDGLPDIDWVEIPAGKFLYGNDKTEKHLDTFWIARYPITNSQFKAFIDDDPQGYNNREWWTEAGWQWKGSRRQPDEYDNPGFRLPNHPRIYVRWYEAIAFAHWLGARLGMNISLPTEEQWEKAARGTTGLIYPYGNEFDATKGNAHEGNNIGQTSAVGIYPQGASPYGVLDMSGNIFEWCLTEYENGDNENMCSNSPWVLRGGSWRHHRYNARSAYRWAYGPDDRHDLSGFRVLCPPSLKT